MIWQDWLPYGVLYVIGAVVTLIIAGLIAEDEVGGLRKFWGTIAALWLVWPLALAGGVLFAIGCGCYYPTRYFWRVRRGEEP